MQIWTMTITPLLWIQRCPVGSRSLPSGWEPQASRGVRPWQVHSRGPAAGSHAADATRLRPQSVPRNQQPLGLYQRRHEFPVAGYDDGFEAELAVLVSGS